MEVENTDTKKIEITQDKENSQFNATYAFTGEEHTLGNLLRNMLMKEY
jgi:DNA-directed RNA polymerase subunit L